MYITMKLFDVNKVNDVWNAFEKRNAEIVVKTLGRRRLWYIVSIHLTES